MKSTTQKGLWGVEYGELGATLKALQDHGVTLKHLARLRAEPDYAKRVADFMLRGGLANSTPLENQWLLIDTARAIMGKNFWGTEEWTRFYGVRFAEEQPCKIAHFPWGKDILNSTCPLCGKVVKDCHFAFWGIDRLNGAPLNIGKFREWHRRATTQRGFSRCTSDADYSTKKSATETTMGLRWHLLHRNIVPGSGNKTYDDQRAMLPVEYEVPSAVTEIAKNLFVSQKTGVWPNPKGYGRCKNMLPHGVRLIVGCGSDEGMLVDTSEDNDASLAYVGIAASRRLPVSQAEMPAAVPEPAPSKTSYVPCYARVDD